MTATEKPLRVLSMPADGSDVGTKTVRISAGAATKLQTISALKEQMGKRFKTVEFLNGLLEKPVDELYEATLAEFDDFKTKKSSRKKL